MAPTGETRTGLPGRTGDEHVLGPVWSMRRQVPELALAVGSALTRHTTGFPAESERVRALVMFVGASCRLGRGFEVADQAVRALRWAQAIGASDLEHNVRVDLAGCARALDSADSVGGLLRPVLDADTSPAMRAGALVEASLCLGRRNWRAELDHALSEADRLYLEDSDLDADAIVLHRCMVRAEAAAQHRRRGDSRAAAEAAAEGEQLLAGLADAAADNGAVRARLVMERVLALLDGGHSDEAVRAGEELLYTPVRAPAAAQVNWLRFAVASRVHRPAGRLGRARDLLHDACVSADRHRLHLALADCRTALAEIDEYEGYHAEALQGLRSAQAARNELNRTVAQARRVLTGDFPPDEQQSDSLLALLTRSSAKSRSRVTKPVAAQRGLAEHQVGRTNGNAWGTGDSSSDGGRQPSPGGGRRRKPEQEPAVGSRERPDSTARHGNGKATGFNRSGLPGLVVTEGSGGRRRAPEPEDDGVDGPHTGPAAPSGSSDSRAVDGRTDEPVDTESGFEREALDWLSAGPIDGPVDEEVPEVADIEYVEEGGREAGEAPPREADPAGRSDVESGLSVLDELSLRLGEPSAGRTETQPAPAESATPNATDQRDDGPDARTDPLPDAQPDTQPDAQPDVLPDALRDHPADHGWPDPPADQPAAPTGSAAYEQTKSEVARWLAALNQTAARAEQEPEEGLRSLPAEPMGSFSDWPGGDPADPAGYPALPAEPGPDASAAETNAPIPLYRSGRRHRDRGDERADPADTYPADTGTPDTGTPDTYPADTGTSDTGNQSDDLALGDLLTEAMLAFHSGSQPQPEDYARRYLDESGERSGAPSSAAALGWPEEWLDPDGRGGPEPSTGDGSGYPSSVGFSAADEHSSASGGTHAGGRRPDTEWRFWDRGFRSDHGD